MLLRRQPATERVTARAGALVKRVRIETWVPVLYALGAGAWIVFSDSLLGSLARSVREETSWSILKGIVFVAASSVALHAALRWALRRERSAHQALAASEVALRHSEDRYRSLFESSADAILAVDGEGRFTDANPAALKLLGFTRDEIRRLTYQEITPERWREMNEFIVREQVPLRGYSDEYEKEYIRKDGATIPVSVTSFARRDAAGNYVGAWAIVRDITERRRSEEALNRSEARFRTLIERSTDIILELDAEGRYQFWSPSATEVLGWTAQERMGKVAFEFLHPDDKARVVEFFRDVVADRPSARAPIRYRCLHKDGSWRQIESYVRNCLGDVAVRAVVVNGRDVTQQRVLEEQFQQSQKLESVGRLAGGVAHDFNNLLTVILSCAESLQDSVRTGAPLEPGEIDDLRAAGERARDLTRQLLAFARKQVIAPVPLDLDALVRETEKLLRRVLGEDVELVTSLEPALRTVRCDPGQIEQVVLNLAVNARDAMPTGGRLTIETANVDIDERFTAVNPWMHPGPHVRLTLRDTGHGMSPDVKAHVFEPFFTTKPKGRGTGLGLATVYGIVKQNGASILVDSTPREGTTFDIYFPATSDEPVAASPSPTRATRRGHETVLVVEDDPQVREVTARSLRAGGYRVLEASQGEEAAAVVERERSRLDLLITDVIMPGGDGRSVVERLRRRQPALRVLYVSGYPQDVIAERSVLAPGIEFLQKPFTQSSLLARVRAVLDVPPAPRG